jgi:hypothetical protein
MPYRSPPTRPFGQPCLCTHWLKFTQTESARTWQCCSCRLHNHFPVQFCQGCRHARDLVRGETDILLVDLGLAQLGTRSTGPR